MHAVRVESPAAARAPAPERRAARARLVAVAGERRATAYAKPRANRATIAIIVAAHAILVAALIEGTGPLPLSKPRQAIVVQLVPPPEPAKATPPSKPKPLPVKVIAPMPAVPPPAIGVPDLPSVQELPAITLPPSTPEPAPVPAIPAPVAAVAAAPAIAPLVPPRYDAAYLDNPAPAYPSAARRLHEEGRVLLRVRVTADGRAGDVDVATSSGSERLDRAALDAVRRWRFVPARRGDEAVAAQVLVPIVFSLDRA
jgi:protein TonB